MSDFAEESSAKPRRRPNRGLPDLAALFDEVDSQAADAKARAADQHTRDLAALSALGQETAAEPVAARRQVRRVDFGDILGEGTQVRAQASAPKPESVDLGEDSQDAETDAGEEHINILPELANYLSPDLWRKLQSPEPARGALFNALERIRSVLYLLSTFLPAHLVQEKMRRPFPGQVNGQILNGSLLFSDVSGFTALSERLATLGPEGAEQVTVIMNRYFAAMLEILSWSGGILLKFAGDATLAYFPEQETGEHVSWAVRAGQRMLRAMVGFAHIQTPKGEVRLQMKVGVATGEFLAASVGTEKRMEYALLGQAISRVMAAEEAATAGGQLVVDTSTTERVENAWVKTRLADGFYMLQPAEEEKIDSFEIRAETRRARGAIPWSASQRAIMAQTEVALRQVQAISPYLPSELVERIVVHARRRQVESEYRPATVMFCNFVGPDALLDLWGVAGVQRVTSLVNAYFTSMNEVITRYGGMVSRIDPYSKGTKMLVLFGAPVAHEDDPQRAVSAALAMNAELEILEESWRRKFARHLQPEWNGSLIQHRIGITFGDTFAGQVGSSTRREYTVMGDQVNLSARLMGAAEMGQILVDSQVQKVITDYFVLTTLPSIRLKGKSKPAPVFQVDGPRDDTLANRARSRGALIGRTAELARGKQLLRQALEGSGATLVIQGPAGVGKSHLADELIQCAIAQGAEVLSIHCRSYNFESPYACWSALLRTLAGITALDYQPQVHYEKLKGLLARLALPLELTTPLAVLMGLGRQFAPQQAFSQPGQAVTQDLDKVEETDGTSFDFVKRGQVKRRGSSLDLWQQLDRQPVSDAGYAGLQLPAQLNDREQGELYEAVWALLERVADTAPQIIFFEDAHWMDQPSRELLSLLKRRIRASAVLFLLACRDDQFADFGELSNSLALGPLVETDTAALVAHLLTSDLAQVIHEQSQGNPLFIAEITHWFKRTYRINAEELKGVLQASNILQKLVLSGLEALPEMQREIARVASVVGNEFRTGEVQALLANSIDAVTLSNHLRALVRERLIVLIEAGADARYAFQQTLVHDILYNSIPYEQRRELHARMALYLSEAPTSRRRAQMRIAMALDVGLTSPMQEVERMAYHFEQAQQWLPAAMHLVTAGDQARLYGLYEKAAAYYVRALANLENLPPGEGDAEADALWYQAGMGRGDMAVQAGEYLAALSSYEAVQSRLAAGVSGDKISPRDEINLYMALAVVLPTQGKAGDAVKLLRQVFKSEAANEPVGVATMAWLLWRSGKDEASQWIQKGMDLASTAADGRMAEVRALLMDLAGDWKGAQDAYLALDKGVGAALTAIRMGDQYMEQGSHLNALNFYRQADQLWRGKARQSGLALALYRQAEVYWQTQDAQTARSLLEQALAALPAGAPSLQASGRTAVQRALKMVTRSKTKRWPAWRWQTYDDEFRISILLQV